MTEYTDLFFDLDRTLWDFDKNSLEALHDTYVKFDLDEKLKGDFDQFNAQFRKETALLWDDFRLKEKTKEEMRISRFLRTFSALGVNDLKLAMTVNAYFFESCPAKPHLMEGAIDVLDYLRPNYRIHLITNGFHDSQDRKLTTSGLKKYFDVLIISGNTPYRKPQRDIFKLALNKAGCSSKQALMIGDDWQKDIFGAHKAGMHQAYYDQGKDTWPKFLPTHRFLKLKELKEFL